MYVCVSNLFLYVLYVFDFVWLESNTKSCIWGVVCEKYVLFVLVEDGPLEGDAVPES